MVDVLPTIILIKISMSFKSDWVCKLNINDNNLIKLFILKLKCIVRNICNN